MRSVEFEPSSWLVFFVCVGRMVRPPQFELPSLVVSVCVRTIGWHIFGRRCLAFVLISLNGDWSWWRVVYDEGSL